MVCWNPYPMVFIVMACFFHHQCETVIKVLLKAKNIFKPFYKNSLSLQVVIYSQQVKSNWNIGECTMYSQPIQKGVVAGVAEKIFSDRLFQSFVLKWFNWIQSRKSFFSKISNAEKILSDRLFQSFLLKWFNWIQSRKSYFHKISNAEKIL